MSYSDADPVPPEPGDDRSVPTARSAHRRVLVGTDGSTTAERAVDRALDVARAHGAHLTVLSTGRRAEQVVAVTHARLEGSGVPVTTVATHGEPAGALADEAVRGGHELVVVGNKGLHGMRRLSPLGSVPGRLSHRLPCALLVVKTT